MSDVPRSIDPADDESPGVTHARSALDFALLGFNRHTNHVERSRLAVLLSRQSRAPFEHGAADREALRAARGAATLNRILVREAVGEFVRRLRDAGMAPEVALVAVKRRLSLSATPDAPGAPWADASLLETDAIRWAIEAYYEAA